MNDYLKQMLAFYNDGKWLKTNLELMAEQSELSVAELLNTLRENGVWFIIEPYWFKPGKDKKAVHAKGNDMILLFKDLKSRLRSKE